MWLWNRWSRTAPDQIDPAPFDRTFARRISSPFNTTWERTRWRIVCVRTSARSFSNWTEANKGARLRYNFRNVQGGKGAANRALARRGDRSLERKLLVAILLIYTRRQRETERERERETTSDDAARRDSRQGCCTTVKAAATADSGTVSLRARPVSWTCPPTLPRTMYRPSPPPRRASPS